MLSRGGTVFDGFAFLDAIYSRTHRQSLKADKDLVVGGKSAMIQWVVSSTRQGERHVMLQAPASTRSRTREPVGVPQAVPMRGPTLGVARMRRFFHLKGRITMRLPTDYNF